MLNQLQLSTIESITCLQRLNRESGRMMALYLITALLVFALFSWALLANESSIRQLILDYLFPQTWHSVSQQLFDFFFESQAKSVLANMILSGSLVVASVFLFPLKEKFSAAFEKDGGYTNGQADEFPLSYQILEESKLLLVYLTAQMVILWIGYYPGQTATVISTLLSYLFLFYTFAVDIISPTLQRHHIRYSVIARLLLKRPLLCLCFGGLFSAPPILLSFWVLNQDAMSLIQMAVILFMVNLLFITLAIPAGTHIASQLLPKARQTPALTRRYRKMLYLLLWLLFFVSGFLHSRLVLSLHHKSQLLKLEYEVDWSSIEFDWRSLGGLLTGDNKTQFRLQMTIHNPTNFDLVVEDSVIRIWNHQSLISRVNLAGFRIDSGQSKNVTLKMDALSNFSPLDSWQKLTEGWHSDLSFELWPGIPFTVELTQPENTD